MYVYISSHRCESTDKALRLVRVCSNVKVKSTGLVSKARQYVDEVQTCFLLLYFPFQTKYLLAEEQEPLECKNCLGEAWRNVVSTYGVDTIKTF